MFVGVELEIESSRGFRRILELLPDVKALAHRPITESDGSLDHRLGVEIVFPPVKPNTLTSKKSVFGRAITALAETGEQNGSVGMHLNVNTTGWTPLKKAVFLATILAMPRSALVGLGGRTLNHYCYQPFNDHYVMGRIVNYTSLNACFRNCHMYAAEFKANRIELRFPGSTTDRKRIKQLMNFIEQLTDFSDSASLEAATMPATYVTAFGIWLSGNKKGQSLREYMGVPRVSPNLNSSTPAGF